MSKTADSLVEVTQRLVQVKSVAGQDPPDAVLHAIRATLESTGITSRIVYDTHGAAVACYGVVDGAVPGPSILLNAPADTAVVGDPKNWSQDPFSGVVSEGWLYGRGAADSKAGIAVFCQVAHAIRQRAHSTRGRLVLIFDGDEHSAAFSGIRRALDQTAGRALAGAYIGYPGHDRMMVGCRGFYRAVVVIHGIGAHSGSSSRRGVNAISRAAALVDHVNQRARALTAERGFPLAPSLSVTAISGGDGFSSVPDRCELNVDCRLTPTFNAAWAHTQLQAAIAELDAGGPDVRPTTVTVLEGWPAYQLAPTAPIVEALQAAAQRVLRRALPERVAGPSSVGNYLATLGVPATSGFGVSHRNVHGADESIDVTSLEPTYEVYLAAVTQLLA